MFHIDIINNAKRNIFSGTVNRVVLMICPFVERTVLHLLLGPEYLGLNSLFTSVLSVLCLAELGFGMAMVYNMYAPMAAGDTKKINALLNVYKKIYRVIALVILCAGLLLIPLIPRLIRGGYPAELRLEWLYLAYLANTVVSYSFFAYLTSILVASQRDDVQSTTNSITRVALLLCQVSVLLFTRSYYAYVGLMPVFTLINNLWVGWQVHRLYPEYKPIGTLTQEERKSIRKLITGTFIQRACEVTRNSMDSIFISAFLGLTLTAIYSNYYAIMNAVTVFVSIVSVAFQGGVGHHVATKSVEENFLEMNRLNFLYLWIGGWCSVCLICLYQPFMRIWMGQEMMLPMDSVQLLVLYFYLLKLGDMITLYFSARGLWWKSRYRAAVETLTNIVLNYVLGRLFGINGIIAATILAWLSCNYIWSTYIIFKDYFSLSRWMQYYLNQGRQTLVNLAALAVTAGICRLIPIQNDYLSLLVRGVFCIIIPNSVFLLVYCRSESFQYLMTTVLGKTEPEQS